MTYVVKIYRSIEVLWKNVYCHQLLGTGNDMRERIYKMADEIFETWPPAMLQLFEELSQAEAETQQLEEVKIYEAGRPKRSSGDARLVSSRMNKVAKKAERDDQRNDVKREHKDYLK